MKKLYLVDVSSMIFRAYYAIRPLTSEKGVPTNAIYGFLSMTVKLLRDIRPDYLVFCFDRKEPSFRKELDERYKANRGDMPEDLVPQMPYIRQLTELLGIPMFDRPGFEADDIIGSLARFGRENNLEVVIVSGDKDFGQLIRPFVSMYDPMKDVTYNPEGVLAKWGVPPEKFIDYLAITGDSSDNIPGIRGVGPKGAQKLLADYGSLEGIYESVSDIKSASLRQKLEDGRDEAYLSRKLVTIVTNIDLGVGLDDLKLKAVQRDQIKNLLDELSFQSFANKLVGEEDNSITGQFEERRQIGTQSPEGAAAEAPTPSHGWVEKLMSPEGIIRWLNANEDVWGWKTDRGVFIAQGDVIAEVDGDPRDIGYALRQKKMRWKGYDLKNFWKEIGALHPRAAWDALLAAYVLKAGSVASLEDVYSLYCGKTLPDLARPSQYLDCLTHLESTLKKMLAERRLEKVFYEIDIPLIPILYSMEVRGIRVDTDLLRRLSAELETDIARIEQEIHQDAGVVFNIASPKQLGDVLFEKLGMPKGKKTKTGYSTNVEVLEKLAPEYPIVDKILKYRELTKLKSTYTDALPELVNPETQRLHTQFNQALTTTGRLASANPNLQNIPIRTERGRAVRRAFIAEQGRRLVAADYSQIELRVLAHITDDSGLIQAFEKDIDIHAATASEVFEVPLEKVTADLRRIAKSVNFGIAYGQGVFGLAENLNISRSEAKDIIERYFQKFSGVKTYMQEIVEKAQENGYVETLFGRRRYIPEIKSKSGAQRKFGERAAINAPIQGTASDIVKMAMIDLYEVVPGDFLLQVHDELIFEIDKDRVDQAIPLIRDRMENCTKLKVPLKVNIAIADNWEDAHS